MFSGLESFEDMETIRYGPIDVWIFFLWFWALIAPSAAALAKADVAVSIDPALGLDVVGLEVFLFLRMTLANVNNGC